jgi:arylsulfatase A-like enzyme
MFTGRPVTELNASWTEPLDGTWPTLAEYLRDRGYRTGGVAGNFFYCNSEWGIDRGFIHYKDYDLSLGHALLGTFVGLRLVKALEAKGLDEEIWFHRVNGRRIAPDVRDDLVRWLDRDRDHPYFAFVNFYDAHDPYVAPDEYYARIDAAPQQKAAPVKVIEDGRLVDAEAGHRRQRLAALRDYEAGIAYLDDQVGALLADLEARGLLENTLVVITSDHGEEFGEHGRSWHGRTLYMPSIHVPLVVRLPDGSRAGERIREPVSLTDLAVTVADVLGEGDDSPFPGSSFLSSHIGPLRSPALSELTLDTRDGEPEHRWFRSLVAADRHYIVSDKGIEELYDYRIDPLEQLDLSAVDTTRLPVLRSALERGLSGVNDGG